MKPTTQEVDYSTLDKKIKGGLLMLKETRLKLQKEDILNLLSLETTTEAETLVAVKKLKDIEGDLVTARLDLELMGIEATRAI
jgi:Holliday junction resolvase